MLSFQDVIDNISEALAQADGKHVADIHNQICSNEIVYLEDSQWEEKEGDECPVDADGCLVNNDGDAETDMEDRCS